MKIVKESEDGRISGIRLNISGNGVNEDVVTGSDGSITVKDLKPGTYTVSEYEYEAMCRCRRRPSPSFPAGHPS